MGEYVNILLSREWICYSRSDLSTYTSDTAVIEELDLQLKVRSMHPYHTSDATVIKEHTVSSFQKFQNWRWEYDLLLRDILLYNITIYSMLSKPISTATLTTQFTPHSCTHPKASTHIHWPQIRFDTLTFSPFALHKEYIYILYIYTQK